MDREAFLRDYWAYYIMLEDKFIHTLNYVELSEDNFNTHSNEYAALMQMIGGELDSFFKIYCGFDPTDSERCECNRDSWFQRLKLREKIQNDYSSA